MSEVVIENGASANGDYLVPSRGGPIPVGERAQDKVADFLRAHPDQVFHYKELATELGLNPSYITQVTRVLRDEGIATTPNRGYWRLRQRAKRGSKQQPEAKAAPKADIPVRADLPDKLTFKLLGELRDGRILLEFPATGDAFVAERI